MIKPFLSHDLTIYMPIMNLPIWTGRIHYPVIQVDPIKNNIFFFIGNGKLYLGC